MRQAWQNCGKAPPQGMPHREPRQIRPISNLPQPLRTGALSSAEMPPTPAFSASQRLGYHFMWQPGDPQTCDGAASPEGFALPSQEGLQDSLGRMVPHLAAGVVFRVRAKEMRCRKRATRRRWRRCAGSQHPVGGSYWPGERHCKEIRKARDHAVERKRRCNVAAICTTNFPSQIR